MTFHIMYKAKDWVNLFLKLGDCSRDRRHCYGDGYQPNKVAILTTAVITFSIATTMH